MPVSAFTFVFMACILELYSDLHQNIDPELNLLVILMVGIRAPVTLSSTLLKSNDNPDPVYGRFSPVVYAKPVAITTFGKDISSPQLYFILLDDMALSI